MSDTYDIARELREQNIRSQSSVLGSFDQNPDDAIRALDLERQTGVDSQAIYADVEGFEQQHKAQLAQQLLRGNPVLRDFVDSHPLAPVVYQNDLAQLDKVTQSLDVLKGSEHAQAVQDRLGPLLDVLRQTSEPTRPTREQILAQEQAQDAARPAFKALNPKQQLLFNYIQGVKEQLGASWEMLSTSIKDTLDTTRSTVERGLAPLEAVGAAGQAGFAPITAVGQVIGDAFERFTGGRVSSGEIQAAMMTAGLFAGQRGEARISLEEARQTIDQMSQLHGKVAPFIEVGQAPPVGVHPVVDDLYKEQAKQDAKNLADLEKEAAKVGAHDSIPDFYEQTLQRATDQTIGIKAEAIRKLYGDKQIEAGDGLLGDIRPPLAEQMILAEAHGGDVQVPLASWLAKVDPEVQKALGDFIRVRHDGMTLDEAKAPVASKAPEEEPERIVGAAVKAGDQVFQGTTHSFAAALAQDAGLKPDDVDGFVTSKGRYVSREEASQIADAANQVRERGQEKLESSTVHYGAGTLRVVTRDEAVALRPDMQPGRMDAKFYVVGDDGTLMGFNDRREADRVAGTDLVVKSIRASAGLSPIPAEGLGHPEGIIPRSVTTQEVSLGGGVKATVSRFLASEAVAEIKTEKITSPVGQKLQEFFKGKLAEMAGDVPIYVVNQQQMAALEKQHGMAMAHAFYDQGIHAIVMGDWVATGRNVVKGIDRYEYNAGILLEEIAHAATVREMDSNYELKTKVTLLRDLAKDWVEQNQPEILQDWLHEYAFSDEYEFVAWAFAHPRFQEVLAKIPLSPTLSASLRLPGRPTVWDALRWAVKQVIAKITGKVPSETILDGVLRLGPEFERQNKLLRERPPGYARPEAGISGVLGSPKDPIAERAKALGMNKERAERYRRLVEKQQAEQAKFQQEQGLKDERERQTKDWKENYARVRSEVEADLRQRPDIAAERLLRDSRLGDKKVKPVRIDSSALTEEQKRSIPPEFVAAGGDHPDAIGRVFGYGTGDALVSSLAALKQEREAAGLTPKAHFKSLVDGETDRQMRLQYGDLERNIVEEAREHVLGPSQLDILHEEMVALAEKSGQLAQSQAELKAQVKAELDKLPISSVSSKRTMADMGRAGQATEDALAAQDGQGALKAKTQQVIAQTRAGFEKKIEKEIASWEKLVKTYSRREPPGIPAEYANWIHDILSRTGNGIRRSVQDLQDAIGRSSHDNLADFVNEKNANSAIWESDENAPSDFKVMPVADFLLDPAYRKTLQEMNPAEFRAVVNSVKTLIKNGREDKKILIGGEMAELADTIQRMTAQLENVFEGKEIPRAFGQKDRGVKHVIKAYWAQLTQIESLLRRFDQGDPSGLFQRAITQPIFQGSYDLHALETRFSKLYRELKFDKADLKKGVDNPLFGDPLADGEKIPMTRENLLAVLQNVGNASNLDKLARGYGIKDPQQILNWLFANTTKEDWDRAQKMGDIFKQAFEESARMYHELSGVAPEKIDLQPIQTPFGTYDGWYHPIVYDPARPGQSKKLMGPSPLEDGSYFRAATPSGYTKQRTGYAAPILLNFVNVPSKLKAILNDTAMRPPVTEVAKIFYDPSFQKAVTKYYGKEFTDLFIPYLKDVAGMRQYKDANQAGLLRVLDMFRQNIVSTLIGLNPSTVLKHGPTAAMLSIKEVGAREFLTELAGLWTTNDALGERNWKFAMENSQELPRRHRNWKETITGAQADVFGDNTLRNWVIKAGATPVAWADLGSAVPTWLATYKREIRDGAAHGDAVQAADTTVRRAHGSSAVAARPALMRNPVGQWVAPFYTFFNEMFQRQYEMAWRAKEMLGQFNEGEYRAGLKEVPNLAKGLWAYVIFPALIEQMVSPLVTGQDSTLERWGKYGLRTLGSGVPVLRDVLEALLGGRDPTVGLFTTGTKMLTDAFRDFSVDKKGGFSPFSRAHAGNTIRHTLTGFGVASGYTNAQMGRTGEFMYNYAIGQEKPKDTWAVLRGLWHGTTKEPKR